MVAQWVALLTSQTSRWLEGPWVRIPTACPQFRTASTRTLGGVGKKGLPAEFARSRPVPGALPPKGESQKKVPHKDVHAVLVSLWRDGAHDDGSVTEGQYSYGWPQR